MSNGCPNHNILEYQVPLKSFICVTCNAHQASGSTMYGCQEYCGNKCQKCYDTCPLISCSHNIVNFEVSNNYECAICHCVQNEGASCYGCDTCDLDICKDCYHLDKKSMCGHNLLEYVITDQFFVCVICNQNQGRGNVFYGCGECKVIECKQCHDKLKPRTDRQNHSLTKFVADHNFYRCDDCDKIQFAGSIMFSCRGCDYDICEKCFGPIEKETKRISSSLKMKIKKNVFQKQIELSSVENITTLNMENIEKQFQKQVKFLTINNVQLKQKIQELEENLKSKSNNHGLSSDYKQKYENIIKSQKEMIIALENELKHDKKIFQEKIEKRILSTFKMRNEKRIFQKQNALLKMLNTKLNRDIYELEKNFKTKSNVLFQHQKKQYENFISSQKKMISVLKNKLKQEKENFQEKIEITQSKNMHGQKLFEIVIDSMKESVIILEKESKQEKESLQEKIENLKLENEIIKEKYNNYIEDNTAQYKQPNLKEALHRYQKLQSQKERKKDKPTSINMWPTIFLNNSMLMEKKVKKKKYQTQKRQNLDNYVQYTIMKNK